ncbi:hypothetical protein QM467_06090 [Rhodoblastus sp. 17X3]|uniref:hypothetical protein n=1 Tax=Rhodoblastus sp. 17X3 TaxID=3047026 RepID=UPI0024B7788B|nr:hypothetical protein [Rhodoblastus sp. 17X3]MDI9847630.1 hypothetical protein [Rhodoblastus sp. 17X3]
MQYFAADLQLLQSKHWSDDAPVLPENKFLDDKPDAPRPRFGEEQWNLIGAIARNNISDRRCVADFTNFSDPVRRLTVKELAMQRLNTPIASLYSKPGCMDPVSVRALIMNLRKFFRFMDKLNVKRLLDITQDNLNNYLKILNDSSTNKSTMQKNIVVIYWLHDARDFLSFDWVPFKPWGGIPPHKVVGGKKNSENKTPRIPEETMGPLLRWALLYVERFSNDIIDASRVYGDQVGGTILTAKRTSLNEYRLKLESWLEDCRRSGKRLPGHAGDHPELNILRIAKLSGLPNQAAYKLRLRLEAAIPTLGIDNGRIPVAVSVLPETGKPWRGDFTEWDVLSECKALITACYIVCAYLSGMRDGEVQDIRRGAYRPTRDETGQIIRHKVVSRRSKGRAIKRTWVIIEPVAKAIEVMEQLTQTMLPSVRRSNFLFVQIRPKSSNPTLKAMINVYIGKFIKTINSQTQPRLVKLGIPAISVGTSDDPIKITTRMFRRTVAWHIANRPFGVVAGMIQYGHACEITFEGYAGSSESGFRAEVEAERETARRIDILEIYEDYKRGVKPAGPMSTELEAEFKNIREQLGDFRGKIVDDRRRMKMLEHLRIRLFPGMMADCFFEPKDAACLSHLKEKDRKQPVAGICDPNCRNACWLKKHLSVWEGSLADVQRLAARNRISPIQRKILRDKAKEYRAGITSIREACHAG